MRSCGQEHGMKIAFIGGRGVISKYSGIETFYEEVGKLLASKGHDVFIYCRSYFTPNKAVYNGIKLIRIPTLKRKHVETIIHSFLSTVHALFCRYDIIHYHAIGSTIFSIIPKIFGKKTVVTVQGLDWKRDKWGKVATWFLKICEITSIRFPNITIVVSRVLQDYYHSKYGKKPYYIPNGVSIQHKKSANKILNLGLEPKQYILFLGRLSPEKNCHLLVQAYKNIETDIKLVFAGGTSHTDSYIKQLRAHQSEKILFLGYVSGELLDELLSNAVIFVLPSDIEGLSIALLEAMGYANCVLSSDIPENLELIANVGYSFQSGNQDDLEYMLRMLLNDEEMRVNAGHRAKNKVEEQYQWSVVCSDTEQVYRSLLNQ
jgi:glycosyltransferase involved in cell wall biosynthesis